MNISSYHDHVAKLKNCRKNTISCTKYISIPLSVDSKGNEIYRKGRGWPCTDGIGQENVNATVITRYELLQH